MFTDKEVAYLKSQPLARLATVSSEMQPDVVPLAFEIEGNDIYVAGVKPDASRKYRNVRDGNDRVALVIDDMESVSPWRPRGIRMYGRAEFVERAGQFGSRVYLRVVPEVSWSWNVEEPSMRDGRFVPNRIVHGDDVTTTASSMEEAGTIAGTRSSIGQGELV